MPEDTGIALNISAPSTDERISVAVGITSEAVSGIFTADAPQEVKNLFYEIFDRSLDLPASRVLANAARLCLLIEEKAAGAAKATFTAGPEEVK